MLPELLASLETTLLDVAPIIAIIFGFQVLVLRRPVANPRRVMLGLVYVVLGLALFLLGLEQALFPLGRQIAVQATDPDFIRGGEQLAGTAPGWRDYYWVYGFAFTLGFAATIAEPALIAVAMKAHAVSGGSISVRGLRLAVALGAALGVSLGTFRIITGGQLHYYIIACYIVVIVQTLYAPRMIIALAYDTGGVTTSTVTVPLVTALGLGLADTIPGRSILLDGFGLISFTCLFPIITVIGYAQIAQWQGRRGQRRL